MPNSLAQSAFVRSVLRSVSGWYQQRMAFSARSLVSSCGPAEPRAPRLCMIPERPLDAWGARNSPLLPPPPHEEQLLRRRRWRSAMQVEGLLGSGLLAGWVDPRMEVGVVHAPASDATLVSMELQWGL